MEFSSSLARHLSKQLNIEYWLILNALTSTITKTPYCIHCSKQFYSKSNLERHLYNSVVHKRIINRLKQKRLAGDVLYLDISDKNGVIIAKTIIDEYVYDIITNKNASVFLTNDGYCQIYIEGKCCALSRYIYFVIYAKEEIQGAVIDHINSDKLDNRMQNLRQLTIQQNANNRSKTKNAKSLYYGVARDHDKWRCTLEHCGDIHNFYYHEELHAAYHYNLLVKQFNLQSYRKLNNIEKPNNFVLQIRNQKRKTVNKIMTTAAIVSKNKSGIAVIRTNNGTEILVDDDDFWKLIQYKWHLNKKGYPLTTIRKPGEKRTSSIISRMVMNCSGDNNVVDHIDGNILDNRKHNLRILTVGQNGTNKTKSCKNTSGYIGVSILPNNKWKYKLSFKGKHYCKTGFNNAVDAAKERDILAAKLNKEHNACFKLNF